MRAAQAPRELSFFEHLEELRARLIRMLIYWMAGSVAGWLSLKPLLALLRYPAEAGAAAAGIEHLPFRIFDPIGGLLLAMTIAGVAGLVLASPLLLMELWGFISPALEPHEKRWVLLVIPAATGLFLAGIAFAYWIAPVFFAYLFRLNQRLGVEGELTLTAHLGFMMRLLLASGAAFELPLIIMFLAYVGLVRSEWLWAKWRYAVVLIAIAAAVITPTADPITMTVFSAPLFVLYFLSIGLVKIVERRRRVEQEADSEAAEAEQEPLTYYQSLAGPEDSGIPLDDAEEEASADH